MKHAVWVDEVKATGGVPDGDILDALRSASTLCWHELDRRGSPRNAKVQIGVKWVAAFMVSCARHGETDFRSILVPPDQQQPVLQNEAARDDGVIGEILREAASVAPILFSTALFRAGLNWRQDQ